MNDYVLSLKNEYQNMNINNMIQNIPGIQILGGSGRYLKVRTTFDTFRILKDSISNYCHMEEVLEESSNDFASA